MCFDVTIDEDSIIFGKYQSLNTSKLVHNSSTLAQSNIVQYIFRKTSVLLSHS